MNSSKQIKYGAIVSYLSIAVNILSGLIYTPWMIEQIGKNQYGLYTLANSVISLLLVDFGLSAAASRYMSRYHARGEEDKAEQFLGAIYKLYIIIDAVIFTALIIVFLLIDVIYVKLTPSELAQFKVVYCIAALFSVINFPFVSLNGVLTAYEKFIQLKLADLLYRVLIVSLVVAALLCGMGLYALVTVNAVAGLTVTVYKLIVIKKTTGVKPRFSKTPRALYKDIFGYSVWTTVAALAQRLVFNITPSILGMLTSAGAIAVFGVVTTVEGYTYTLTTAINGMFMPKISRIYAGREEEKDISSLMLRVGKFQFALAGAITVGFAVIGKQFITLWMNESYLDAYYGILLVIIPGAFYYALQIANTAILVQNKVKITAMINTAIGVTNIVLSFILSRFYGVIGACLSIFCAYTLRAVLCLVIYNRVLKIDILRFCKKCYLRMLPSMLAALVLAIPVCRVIPGGGWLTLAVRGAAVAGIYLVSVALLGINKEERKFIIGLIKR